MRTPILQWEPDWVREAVETSLPGTAPALADEFHRLAETIYDMPPERRPESLSSLYAYFLVRLGLRDLVSGVLSECASLEVPSVLVSGPGEGSEGVFLNQERTAVLVRVKPERVVQREALTRWLRHELRRVEDIAGPTFGYPLDASPWPAGPYLDLIRDRYGLLWGIWSDARIERRGAASLTDSAGWRGAFDRTFAKVPPDLRAKAFAALRASEDLTHARLLSWAERPEGMVADLTGTPPGDLRLPGAPCPLCRFPTFDWAAAAVLTERIVAAVRVHFPRWGPAEGICGRCLELYQLRSTG